MKAFIIFFLVILSGCQIPPNYQEVFVDPSKLDDQTITFTDAEISRVYYVHYTKDISAILPPGLTNVKSVLVFCLTTVYASAAKVDAGNTSLIGVAVRGIYYDIDPGTGNAINWTEIAAQVSGKELEQATGSTTVIPVNYIAGVPYITWAGYMSFANMLNASGIYYVRNVLNYQGYSM